MVLVVWFHQLMIEFVGNSSRLRMCDCLDFFFGIFMHLDECGCFRYVVDILKFSGIDGINRRGWSDISGLEW